MYLLSSPGGPPAEQYSSSPPPPPPPPPMTISAGSGDDFNTSDDEFSDEEEDNTESVPLESGQETNAAEAYGQQIEKIQCADLFSLLAHHNPQLITHASILSLFS